MDMEISLPGGKKVRAEFGNFTVDTDQPQAFGGDNSAPSPFALFQASLGTCAGYYVLDFCQGRDISTDDIKIHFKTEKNEETKMIGKIRIELELGADFPEKYKKAVVKAASLCTVKKHMQNPPDFEIVTV